MNPDIPSHDDSLFRVVTFYKFVLLADYADMRAPLLQFCREHRVKGTILLAAEGINGTIAAPSAAIEAVLERLREDPRLADLEHKESRIDAAPFYRMKVKLKKEIVTMGVCGLDPARKAGVRLNAHDWNRLISDPDVLLIDTRNHYEYEVGTFSGAVSPNTGSFTEFPEYVKKNLREHKERKIAMFCTGGIRCEKATAYLLSEGFREVYHLQGGILKYLEEIAPEENRWQGECFVFDGRVALNHELDQGTYELCYGCRMPVSAKDRTSPLYETGVSCPRCHDELTEQKRASLRERQYQVTLAAQRKQQHIGQTQ